MPKVSWHFQGNGYVKIKSSKGKKIVREEQEELIVGKKKKRAGKATEDMRQRNEEKYHL